MAFYGVDPILVADVVLWPARSIIKVGGWEEEEMVVFVCMGGARQGPLLATLYSGKGCFYRTHSSNPEHDSNRMMHGSERMTQTFHTTWGMAT